MLNRKRTDHQNEELEKYQNILKSFGFEIRVDDIYTKRRYYVYSEQERYTNISFRCDIEIHTNYIKNGTDLIFDEKDFKNLKISRSYDGEIYYIGYTCSDTESMRKYLNKLLYKQLREKKLKRVI